MPKSRSTTLRIDEDGQVQPRSQARWLIGWLRDQFQLFADGRIVLTLERPKRSLKQNAYYWGVVVETVREGLLEAGQPLSAEAIHEHYKAKYLGAEGSFQYTDRESGEVHEIVQVRSTTDLDTTEFHDYVEQIRNDELVRELGVYIPEPGEHVEAQ